MIKSYWKNQGYYATLPYAVQGLVDLVTKVPDRVIVMLGVLTKLHQLIEKVFQRYTEGESKCLIQS